MMVSKFGISYSRVPLSGSMLNLGSVTEYPMETAHASIILGRNRMRDHRLDLDQPPPGLTQNQRLVLG